MVVKEVCCGEPVKPVMGFGCGGGGFLKFFKSKSVIIT